MSILASIVGRCGGSLFDGARAASIPAPGHSARDRSVSLRLTDDGKIMIYCFGDSDWRDVRNGLIADGLATPGDFAGSVGAGPQARARAVPRRQLQKARVPASMPHARQAWAERAQIWPPIVSDYLERRGVAGIASSDAIGAHEELALAADPAKGRNRAPCLLARLSSPDSRFCGVQATFLFKTADAVKKRRLVYGRAAGASIQLSPPGATLLIGEGLETAASGECLHGAPAWAMLNAHNLSVFEAPRQVRTLIIAADHDRVGLAAAEACRKLNRRRNLTVEILVPERSGADWNDVWREQTRRP